MKLFLSLILGIFLLVTPAFAGVDAVKSAQQYIDTGTGLISSAIKQIGVFEWTHLDAEGNVIANGISFNNLADEGESIFLDCVLRATNCPSTFFLRLSDSSTPCSIIDTNDLTAASAGEPSSNGYAAQELPRNSTGWVSLALDSGDFMATSAQKTFSASGGSWGPVHCAFVATTSNNTGKLIAYTGLSTGRTLASGESLQVTYRIKLQ